jgi:hypothetical protein
MLKVPYMLVWATGSRKRRRGVRSRSIGDLVRDVPGTLLWRTLAGRRQGEYLRGIRPIL